MTSRSLTLISRRALFSFIRRPMSSSSTTERSPDTAEFREFELPVPWGKIAGKEWGNPDGHPWLVFHGWLDNCGSFDTLAPLMDKRHRLICADLPGHGFSSHIPQGFSYHYLESLHVIRRIARHFDLTKFGLMGHSLGGGISMVFAATHPEMVTHLIMLDTAKPVSKSPTRVVERTRKSVDELINIEDKVESDPTPIYSYEEAKSKLMQAAAFIHGENAITEFSADLLLKRGLIKMGDGFTYSRDLKHRISSLYTYPQEVIIQFAASVSCPHLIIKASQGPYYESKENSVEVINIYKATNPDFQYEEVEGSHHVHLNNPERVIKPIEKFLKNQEHTFRKASLESKL